MLCSLSPVFDGLNGDGGGARLRRAFIRSASRTNGCPVAMRKSGGESVTPQVPDEGQHVPVIQSRERTCPLGLTLRWRRVGVHVANETVPNVRVLTSGHTLQRLVGPTAAEPSNKGMKLTSVERTERSQLIPGVLRTAAGNKGGRVAW